MPLGLGGLKMTMNFEKLEEREPEFAEMRAKGQGVGALMDMKTSFTLSDAGDGTSMAWEADVKIAGPVSAMGQRVLQQVVNSGLAGSTTMEARVIAAASEGGAERGSTRRLPRPTRPSPRADALDDRLGRRPAVSPPFRVGVMQLTMEPLDEMLESARVMDRAGMDTIWLAEAYPWWQARDGGALVHGSSLPDGAGDRASTIGWGIISPFTRHPVQVAMDARVVQEAAGPGRFLLGFGTSKIFLNNIRSRPRRRSARCATR